MKGIVDVYLSMVESNPPWTAAEEKEFIRSCTTRTGKWKDKDRFVNEAMKHNLSLVFSLVGKMSFKPKDEDVIQRVVIAMVEALKQYDPKKGVKISTWITNPIRWAIRHINRMTPGAGYIEEDLKGINYRKGQKYKVVKIDAAVSEDSDDTVGDMISSASLCPRYAQMRNIRTEQERRLDVDIQTGVRDMMEELPKYLTTNEMIVVNRLLSGHKMSEISVELKLSRMRISQISAAAFEKIRRTPMGRQLRELVK